MSKKLSHKLVVALALASGGAIAIGASACQSRPAAAQDQGTPQQPVLGTWVDAGATQGAGQGAGTNYGAPLGQGSAVPNSTEPGTQGTGMGSENQPGSAVNPNPGSAVNPNPGSANPNQPGSSAPSTAPVLPNTAGSAGSAQPNTNPSTIPPTGPNTGTPGAPGTTGGQPSTSGQPGGY
jgi:hypothetical protein